MLTGCGEAEGDRENGEADGGRHDHDEDDGRTMVSQAAGVVPGEVQKHAEHDEGDAATDAAGLSGGADQ